MNTFVISSLHRDDILDIPEMSWVKKEQLTDEVMERIASKLGDDYCEQLFWQSLEIITKHVLEG